MAKSLQELSDRLEIQDLFVDYATAVDAQNIDAFDNFFTPDAYIDYRAVGGVDGDLATIKAFLKEVLPAFPATQHMLGNSEVKLDGDRATARTLCFNPMVTAEDEDDSGTFFLGLYYRDKLVRTPAGWRISERIEERSWGFNIPSGVNTGD